MEMSLSNKRNSSYAKTRVRQIYTFLDGALTYFSPLLELKENEMNQK